MALLHQCYKELQMWFCQLRSLVHDRRQLLQIVAWRTISLKRNDRRCSSVCYLGRRCLFLWTLTHLIIQTRRRHIGASRGFLLSATKFVHAAVPLPRTIDRLPFIVVTIESFRKADELQTESVRFSHESHESCPNYYKYTLYGPKGRLIDFSFCKWE